MKGKKQKNKTLDDILKAGTIKCTLIKPRQETQANTVLLATKKLNNN